MMLARSYKRSFIRPCFFINFINNLKDLMMTWTKNKYPDAMKHLDKDVRDKAIEIANALVEERQMEGGKAIPIAINKAKESES